MKTELIAGFMIGVFFGLIVGFMASRMHFENDAVKHGKASFVHDGHGNEAFTWSDK